MDLDYVTEKLSLQALDYVSLKMPCRVLKRFFMKKTLVYLSVAVLFLAVFASCRSHERCPAYGKAKTESTTTKPV